MKLAVRLFLILSLLVPAGPVPSFAQKTPEDCVICGHACCCPEACAPKIKEMKKKMKAQECDQPASLCQVKPSQPASTLTFHERTLTARPMWGTVGFIHPGHFQGIRMLKVSRSINFLSPIQDVLTPPPESSLA